MNEYCMGCIHLHTGGALVSCDLGFPPESGASKCDHKRTRFGFLDCREQNIEINVSKDGSKVWINTESKCLVRIQGIYNLKVIDNRIMDGHAPKED